MSELQDKVVVLAAGGRIVQKLPDQSELSDEEISAFIPDFLHPMSVFRKWSFQPVSNYTLNMCADIVHMAKSMIHDEKAKAIVITCAVHAMAELAYFSDLIWDLNSPLIFTASIFSANSPNSETRNRLTQAVTAALSQSTAGKGALICLNDALYSPADIIRISNYRRADLQMFSPLGIYTQPGGDYIHLRNPRTRSFRTLTSPLPRNLPILTAALGSDDLVIRTLAEKADTLDGLILSGLGDGDVPSSWIHPQDYPHKHADSPHEPLPWRLRSGNGAVRGQCVPAHRHGSDSCRASLTVPREIEACGCACFGNAQRGNPELDSRLRTCQ